MRLFVALFVSLSLHAQQQLARDIFKQLIEINTTDSVGDNTRAAEAMAARFREAGYPASDIQVLAPQPRKGNLVVYALGGRSMRRGSLDGREAFALWVADEFTLTRGSTGGLGAIQGEQQRQWSSGKSVACRLTVAAVRGAKAEIASGPAEFIGADGSHRSNAT
jgi:hypothetical protein